MSYSIREQRFKKVLEIISKHNVKSILEIGCGDGKFVPYIKKIEEIQKIAVIDKDEKKIRKIKRKHEDIESYCTSFANYHQFLDVYDCIVAIEVIEHLLDEELQLLQEVLFDIFKPRLVILTTPNIEYNVNYPILYDGLRHNTHLFEFSPTQLIDWGNNIIKKFKDYTFYTGFCDLCNSSQIIVFTRRVEK